MKYYRCHCCSATFQSDKLQDPQRDTGFGTCDRCVDTVIESWVKYGFLGTMGVLAAKARLSKYA